MVKVIFRLINGCVRFGGDDLVDGESDWVDHDDNWFGN